MQVPTRQAQAILAGRGVECAKLDQLLSDARRGQSGVLVLRGEPGIGKTTLLEYVAERAAGCRLMRAVGVEWEMELPFSGLHQVCVELLEDRIQLPAPQSDALATAFGLNPGQAPDRFLVGLAVLGLLSNAAEHGPVVWLVDDVQWVDRSSAQVLAFVARRLAAESVVLVFAEREPGRLEELTALPELRLAGLEDAAAGALLTSITAAPLDERVRARILAEARGNPLALLEFAREAPAQGFAGGFGLPDAGSLPDRLEASFRRRVQELPADTQRLLLLAAADPTGEPALLARACETIDLAIDRLSPAEEDDLLELGAQVTFRHPLLRSAIYRVAPPEQRRAAHQALAAATDVEFDPDRRAWHRAHAIAGEDEDVALELEQSAARARARGGLAAAAAFLQRSAVLTPDPVLRARRALEAAASKHLSGASQDTLTLLARAGAGPLDALDHARVKLLQGEILDLRRSADGLSLLLDAARELEPLDVALARDAYLAAVRAAMVAGRLGSGLGAVARAALQAPRGSGKPRAVDRLLDGLAVRFTDGYSAGAPELKRALAAFVEEGEREDVNVRWPWLARRVAPDLFADQTWLRLASHSLQVAREAGALGVLPIALNNLAHLRCLEGDLDGATALLDESDEITGATGVAPLVVGRLTLAGLRGREPEALALCEAAESAAAARGEGVVLTHAEHARAVLYNGLGRYELALASARSASARDELMLTSWSLPELVEAATRCGNPAVAQDATERLSERARAADTPLALGIDARSRALSSDRTRADGLYREAIDRLAGSRAAVELARAHLLYGEWLRRDRRRIEARDHLQRAQEMFASMGAHGFAGRAGRELLATGASARKRTAETRDELTAQEMQIARFAREGLSNPEIGARLFISPRTVEYHLHKVFAKLGITSREHLDRVL